MRTLLYAKNKLSHILLIVSLFASLIYVDARTSNVSAAVTLASYIFSISDGASTAKDLNDTYNTKADSGYKASSGAYSSSSLLYASVANPSANDYRKLEWSKASEYSFNNTTQPATPLIAASEKNPWGTTPFFLIKTSTKDYESPSITFRLGASKKGPRDYKVQYSTNGSTYTDISDSSFSLTSNKILYQRTVKLPDSAGNQNTLYIRIIASSTTTVEKGSTTTDTKSGEIAINNITISGTSSKSNATAAPKSTTSSKTTAAPKNNDNTVAASSSSNSSGITSNKSAAQSSSSLKKIKTLKLTSYKKGTKTIKGETVKKAKIHITVGKKNYTATASKKGAFKVKLLSKLKKGTTIKIYAEKKGYSKSKIKKYTVK